MKPITEEEKKALKAAGKKQKETKGDAPVAFVNKEDPFWNMRTNIAHGEWVPGAARGTWEVIKFGGGIVGSIAKSSW